MKTGLLEASEKQRGRCVLVPDGTDVQDLAQDRVQGVGFRQFRGLGGLGSLGSSASVSEFREFSEFILGGIRV